MDIKIIGTAWPFRGGLAAFNERLAREFQKQGHRVSVETFSLQYPSILFPGKSQFATWEKPSDLTIRRSVNSVNPINWIKSARRIRKENPDLVIFKYWIPFMSPCFSTLARIIRRNRKTKVICLADNIIPHEKRPGDNFLTSIFLHSIDGIVTMSKKVSEDVTLFRKDLPSALSPHPLFDEFGSQLTRESALEKLGLDSAPRYLLFFGFIRDYKGLDLLLKALADAEVSALPVKLMVAGEFYCDDKPYLELIDQLKLRDKVILKSEFIANQDVNQYFCAADLIVQPYKHATQSGVTQIGYHFHKPMLVTNVGGLGEIVPHHKVGYVVNPIPGEIASAILDFYKNRREEEFTQGAREESKKYQWEKMADALLSVHKEICRK